MSEKLRLLVNGQPREVTVLSRSRNAIRFMVNEREYAVEFPASVPAEKSAVKLAPTGGRKPVSPEGPRLSADGSSIHVTAPIPGVICEVTAVEGSSVAAGELLFRLEAMKMQNGIFAPAAGVVSKIHVEKDTEVRDGQLLLELKPN